MAAYTLQQAGPYRYVDEGTGPVLMPLHGLFGALSNWGDLIEAFKDRYRIIIPLLPIAEPAHGVSADVQGLRDYVMGFVEELSLGDLILIGNSLGGHVALMVALQAPNQVQRLILTGSSGLFEAGMGSGIPRRGDYAYIKERVEFTFYNPLTATQELVDEVFDLVNDRNKAMRILHIARNAQRMNMAENVRTILAPTLLIWGLNDTITPPTVAHEFHRLIPNAQLHFIDHCGHAAMMEQPRRFNELVARFLGLS